MDIFKLLHRKIYVVSDNYMPAEYVTTVKRGKKEFYKVTWTNRQLWGGRFHSMFIPIKEAKLVSGRKQLRKALKESENANKDFWSVKFSSRFTPMWRRKEVGKSPIGKYFKHPRTGEVYKVVSKEDGKVGANSTNYKLHVRFDEHIKVII